MKLSNLKKTAAQIKGETNPIAPGKLGGEQYGYNSRVTLDHDMLQKMGIDKLPNTGDKVHLQAKGHVLSTSQNIENGKARNRVELQLTHMGLGQGGPATAEDAVKQGVEDADS